MTDKAEVGDWIRFYQGGKLIIGVVEYITFDTLKRPQYNTDQGVTTNFVEVRKKIIEEMPKPQPQIIQEKTWKPVVDSITLWEMEDR